MHRNVEFLLLLLLLLVCYCFLVCLARSLIYRLMNTTYLLIHTMLCCIFVHTLLKTAIVYVFWIDHCPLCNNVQTIQHICTIDNGQPPGGHYVKPIRMTIILRFFIDILQINLWRYIFLCCYKTYIFIYVFSFFMCSIYLYVCIGVLLLLFSSVCPSSVCGIVFTSHSIITKMHRVHIMHISFLCNNMRHNT